MTPDNDLFLTKLTVCLRDADNHYPVGSGIIYNASFLNNSIYILTAAHCLYYDKDGFQQLRDNIIALIYNPTINTYESIELEIQRSLVGGSADKDIAVIVVEKERIKSIIDTLPNILSIKERSSITSFALKGFPSATGGQELVLTQPKFNQDLPTQKRFQLLLTDDFTTEASAESKVDGFSGSGVFLENHNELYLFGIFTRFRDAQKIIYCQYIDAINDILDANYLPAIAYTYIGDYGLTPEFFKNYNESSVKNLGPRFSEKLNYRLPIVSVFHDLKRNDTFKHRILMSIDKWLLSPNYSSYDKSKTTLADVEAILDKLKKYINDWSSTVEWSADKPIDVAELKTRLGDLEAQISEKESQIYIEQRKERQGTINKNDAIDSTTRYVPYEGELAWLRNERNALYDLESDLQQISFPLANSPVLIIKGEAGCGKSHLLGDIANDSIKSGLACLLFLGQLFSSGKSIWQNIIDQLGLTCTKDELLDSLNNIGRQQGSRLLIMIDALNEGVGKDLWKDAVHGFIGDVLRYPFIALVLTVRTTYFHAIIQKDLQNDPRITFKTHEGFKGNEYSALKLFCGYYGLLMPNFPILSPEFTSPLFLQLVCQGVKTSGKNSIPQGFQGITTIFSYYVEAVYERLKEKRDEYQNRKYIIKDAILNVAMACFFQKDARILPYKEADKLFLDKFPHFKHLLNDLIHENVFIQTHQIDEISSEEYEMLYFSYERIGDYFIAETLLNNYHNLSEVKKAFQKGQELGTLLNDYYWRNRGILEALAVLLPEKYKIEIIEVFEWAAKSEESEFDSDTIIDWLVDFMWESLKWRTPENIDDKKIIALLRKYEQGFSNDKWLLGLEELSTVHNHPFNSDRLFKNLSRLSMPERDAFFQLHMRYYSNINDHGNAYPLRRLIDWAWQKDISGTVEPETARLAGQTLAWLLSSTDRQLRDQATKAMVNLLEEQPEALIKIMRAFKNIDDMYVTERLFAVAYGCVLRTIKIESIQKIARYVNNLVFKNGMPPAHVLLRDYARNIIEYAFHRGVIKVNMQLIRPPYKSKLPTFPTQEEIQKYKHDFIEPDRKIVQEKERIAGQIYFSTIAWDFGRYIVESAVRDFTTMSFTIESEFIMFKKRLKGNLKTLLNLVLSEIKCLTALKAYKEKGITIIAGTSINDHIKNSKESLDYCIDQLKSFLSNEDFGNLKNNYLPNHRIKFSKRSSFKDSLDAEPIKRWIVQRAFELGYDVDIHGSYDRTIGIDRSRFDKNIERIGKKYQWIAFHEVIAYISDNYYSTEDSWNTDAKYSIYDGAWRNHLRDIDPIYITKNREATSLSEDSLQIIKNAINYGWWFDTIYNYWSRPDFKWVNNTQDLPLPQNIISKTDKNGIEWLYLKINCSWHEPKKVGEDTYNRSNKEIWYMINGYIIRKNSKARFLNWLEEQNFFGRWMPETHKANLSLFNRENYWSPISIADSKEQNTWEKIDDTLYKVMVTTSEATGEMSTDKSEAHIRYDMPSRALFEGLKLSYASEDGSFKNKAGEIVVTNINPKGVLVRKQDLLNFLDENNYEIIWTLLGEKNVFNTVGPDKNNHFMAINGVYYLKKNIIEGKYSISKRS